MLIEVDGGALVAVAHLPEEFGGRGVLMVPGAPQYRAGPHRLFVDLARHLANHGVAVLRMDRRGYGDSDGPVTGFEDAGPELAAAVEALRREAGVSDITILGLCDGASAALLHGTRLAGVSGLVLLNPWARTEQAAARALLGSYYLPRLLRWRRWLAAASSFARFRGALGGLAGALLDGLRAGGRGAEPPGFVADMLRHLVEFRGASLLVLSGRDLTAAEFDEVVRRTLSWPVLQRTGDVAVAHLKEADHTFSSRQQKALLAETILHWLNETGPAGSGAGPS